MTPLPNSIVEKLRDAPRTVQPPSTGLQDLSRARGSIYFMFHGVGEQPIAPPVSRLIQSNFEFLQKKLSTSTPMIQRSISIDSRIMHGNPVFSGTRVPVYQVFEELSDGTTVAEILEGYPSMCEEQIQAALEFAGSLLRIYSD